MPLDPSAVRIAANVRAEMARHGLSQEAFGLLLGMSQSRVSVRLRALVTFNVVELLAVAEVLEVPVAVLLGGLPVATAAVA